MSGMKVDWSTRKYDSKGVRVEQLLVSIEVRLENLSILMDRGRILAKTIWSCLDSYKVEMPSVVYRCHKYRHMKQY